MKINEELYGKHIYKLLYKVGEYIHMAGLEIVRSIIHM